MLRGTDFEVVESSPRLRAMRTAELAGLEPRSTTTSWSGTTATSKGLTTGGDPGRYPGWTIWGGPWPGGETDDPGGGPRRQGGRAGTFPAAGHQRPVDHPRSPAAGDSGPLAAPSSHGWAALHRRNRHDQRARLGTRRSGCPVLERLPAQPRPPGPGHNRGTLQQWPTKGSGGPELQCPATPPGPRRGGDSPPPSPVVPTAPLVRLRPPPGQPARQAPPSEEIGIGPNTRCYEHPDRLAGANMQVLQ